MRKKQEDKGSNETHESGAMKSVVFMGQRAKVFSDKTRIGALGS